MSSNEKFNGLMKQLEGVRQFSQLFEAKDHLEAAESSKEMAFDQLSCLLGLKRDCIEEFVNNISGYTQEELLSKTLEEKHSLIENYLEPDYYEDISEEIFDNIFTTSYEMCDMVKEIDALMIEYKQEMDSAETQIKSISNEYGDIHLLLKESLMAVLEEEHTEKVYIAARAQLQALDDALSLRPVIELYTDIGGKNTKKEYIDIQRREIIIKKYVDNMKRLGIKENLSTFIEKDVDLFIEEENRSEKDIVIYSIMKYIAGKPIFASKFSEGMFMVQLSINFYQLFTGCMTDENRIQFTKGLNDLSKVLQ